jgi:hypothetical protein
MSKHTIAEVELDGDTTYRITTTSSCLVLVAVLLVACVVGMVLL